MKRKVLTTGVILGLSLPALLAIACSTADPEDPKDRESESGGAGDDTAETEGDGSGGGRPGTGGQAIGGLGGSESAGGGDPEASGGSDGKKPVCVPPPDGLELFFNQAPFPPPVSEELFDKSIELIFDRHATVHASSFGSSAGPVGTAIDFEDDVSLERSSPTSAAVAPWPASSLEFWVKTTDENANLVAFYSSFSPGLSYWTSELGNDGRVEVHLTKGDEDGDGPDFGADWSLYSTKAVNDGKPHHIVIVHDFEATSVRLFLDGKPDSTASLAEGAPMGDLDLSLAHLKLTHAETHPLIIGGNGRSHYFEGQIDEVSLYSSRLSESTVESLFEAGSAGKCLD